MKNIKYIIALSLFAFLFGGCDKFDFDKEVYKNVAYILSDNDEFNVYNRAIADLSKDVDTVYITVGISGSNNTSNEIPIELTPYYKAYRIDSATYNDLDKARLFYQYNKSHYDIDFKNWSNFLPEDKFMFLAENKANDASSGNVTLKAVIPAGKSKVSIPVLVNGLEQLSPDSIYHIDYALTNAGGVEINQYKKDVLIPIYWKNAWTNTKNPVSYDMYGEQFSWRVGTVKPVFGSERVITGSPILFPISKNEIRIAAGILGIEKTKEATAREQIDEHSIVLKVNNDNTVDIRSYNNLVVEKVIEGVEFYDTNYPNTFYIDEQVTTTGIKKYFKTFSIQYRYKLAKDAKHPVYRNFWTYCKMQLRYEYQPNAE